MGMGELIEDPFRAARLVLSLRREGITDHGVLNVVEKVSRAKFVDPSLADLADEDCELPLPCGQTQLRPSLIARALQALDLQPGQAVRVLVMGEDSGYLASLLAELGHHVYVVSRFHTLVEHIRQRAPVTVRVTHGDLLTGWPSASPFDRIIILGGMDEVSLDLLDQLSPNGFCLAAVGENMDQTLENIGKTGDRLGTFGPIKTVQIAQGASTVL